MRAHLARLAEEALPEFKRKRPKYYYYFEWMRQRIEESCGQLPAPVMDKLLTHDATELDLLCTHPAGIQRQACTSCCPSLCLCLCLHHCLPAPSSSLCRSLALVFSLCQAL